MFEHISFLSFKNNIPQITKKFKELLYEVEPDDNKIINSLVKYLYSKPSNKKKKLLWFTYGEELFNNLNNNIDCNTTVCMKCGKRVTGDDIIRNKCQDCRNKEIKELGGKKIIKCLDCGIEFDIDTKNTKAVRCEQCTKIHRNNYQKELMKQRRTKC